MLAYFFFLNLAVAKFNANIVFVTCSISVVQLVPLKPSTSKLKQDLWVASPSLNQKPKPKSNPKPIPKPNPKPKPKPKHKLKPQA